MAQRINRDSVRANIDVYNARLKRRYPDAFPTGSEVTGTITLYSDAAGHAGEQIVSEGYGVTRLYSGNRTLRECDAFVSGLMAVGTVTDNLARYSINGE